MPEKLSSTKSIEAGKAQRKARMPKGSQASTFAKRSTKSRRSGQPPEKKAERARKKTPEKKAEAHGPAGSTRPEVAQQKRQPPSVAELKERVATLVCRTGKVARQDSPQRERKGVIPVSMSSSGDESSPTTTPLSQRKTEEGQVDYKKSSRSRSAISLRSRKARSIAPSRSRSRAKAKREESGSSNPSQRRGYAPSVARSSRSRSVENARNSRSASESIAKKRHYRQRDLKEKESKETRDRARSNRRRTPLNRRRSNTYGTDIRDMPGWDEQKPTKQERQSAEYREEMETRSQKKEIQGAASGAHFMERQGQQAMRACQPKVEASQSTVKGAKVRFITAPWVDKRVGQTQWPYAPKSAQKAKSMEKGGRAGKRGKGRKRLGNIKVEKKIDSFFE